MKPENILNAFEEVFTEITSCTTPANEVLNTYTRSRRYIGSKDRHQLADYVWYALRHYKRLQFAFPNLSWKERVQQKLPDLLSTPNDVAWEVPAWMIPLVPNATVELPALLELPPIVLRVNGDRAKVVKTLLLHNIHSVITKLSPYGLILNTRTNLNTNPLFLNGTLEIQDEGSQCIALDVQVKPKDKVLDFCAGGGGKSLCFAQVMQNQGVIWAHDISQRSLNQLLKRAARAHITIIKTTTNTDDLPNGFDKVVVDAPCSGTGIWRRCPDARFKLTQNHVADLVKKQQEILHTAAQFVKPGGDLYYMTCSLLTPENEEQAATFLKTHPDFQQIMQKRYSPATTHTDGFFVAHFRRHHA